MPRAVNRRQFINRVATGSTAALILPRLARPLSPNSKLNVGFVAVGGRAGAHTKAAHKEGLQCIAFAEVDKRRWRGIHGRKGWEEAKGYTDWRKMFEKHGDELDLIFVSTPDHTHYAPSMTAVSMGIHCYTEKPLAWSVKEAQLLAAAYQKNQKVVTQMGNQGHGQDGWRNAYDYVKAGALGDILEFHTWTNRPVWPQGGGRPKGKDEVPAGLDWDAWIGSAAMRDYKKSTYHSFKWRGFVDFGSGALGDMACHTTDGIYAIMNPGFAESVEPIFMTDKVKDQWPSGMTVRAKYRATKERPGFTTYWYEGKGPDGGANMPETPEELKSDGKKLPRTGNLIIGTKGKMLVVGDYWNKAILIPESYREEFGQPDKLLERSPGNQQEFFMACRGDKPREFSQSNYGYSGPMTANIQLGNLCARAGKKLELNEAGEITNDKSVNALAWREPREGWGALKTNI